MKLNEKIKNLPQSSGVYLMKDSLDTIIYVGKSKNLKMRVSSYFQNSKNHSFKILKLVKNIKNLDYIETDTEFEALMLECKLIIELKPRYNKVMKNPKSYCYISLKLCENYPYIKITSTYIKDNECLCFGPYNSKRKVKKAIKGIKEYFKILCLGRSNGEALCFNCTLGMCRGICNDKFSHDEYRFIYNKIIQLLNGEDRNVCIDLNNMMQSASIKLNFEEAAKYRDYITAIEYIVNKNKVLEFTRKNKNIVVLEYLTDNEIKVFLIKGNKIIFTKKYKISDMALSQIKKTLKTLLITKFSKTCNGSLSVEREELDKSQIIYNYLKNKSDCVRHIIVLNKWVKHPDNIQFDKNIDFLLK